MAKQVQSPEASAQGATSVGDAVASRSVSFGGDATTAKVQRPTVAPTAPFFLAYHPLRWTVMEGQVVPDLAPIFIQPGLFVNEGNEGDWRNVLQRWAAQSWTVLPHDVDGVDSYLSATDAEKGVHHHTRWESCISGAPDKDFDQPGYVEWLSGLVASGKLPKPSRHALDRLLSRLRKAYNAAARDAHRAPQVQTRANRLAADIEAVKAELAKLTERAPRVPSKAVTLKSKEGES